LVDWDIGCGGFGLFSGKVLELVCSLAVAVDDYDYVLVVVNRPATKITSGAGFYVEVLLACCFFCRLFDELRYVARGIQVFGLWCGLVRCKGCPEREVLAAMDERIGGVDGIVPAATVISSEDDVVGEDVEWERAEGEEDPGYELSLAELSKV
jgi:hypothetical protein